MYQFQTITTNQEPRDVIEGSFATLYFNIQEKYDEAQEQTQYESVQLVTDEAANFDDVEALKKHYAKEARSYMLKISTTTISDRILQADEISINRLSHFTLIATHRALEKLSMQDEAFKKIYDEVFSETVDFKTTSNTEAITLKDISKAHENAMLNMSKLWNAHNESQEHIKEETSHE